ncbi:DUF3826 domain-containing protein [Desertivirga arenae]|uniref:DUF3826 domain-containing protein n=1 Tax=Desertivirga arenae TaxID=2810309 RepID=UPI001A975C83|nr:DUF3826 domain-containing protein [Pedobacter sp. SYSU D00823]
MKSTIKPLLVALALTASTSSFVFAQSKPSVAEYRQVVTGRADKIVKGLSLADSTKYFKVREIIADQYVNLSTIHDARNAKIKEVKEANKDNKEKSASEVKAVELKADKKLAKVHKSFIKKLSKQLSAQEVEGVKNGLTYNVLPNTYRAYQEMLPNLTEEQKKQILAWLTEAREHAMDAESSEKKHAWFGKYKGRINNYLSAAGIDMNKEGKAWQERIKAQKAQQTNVN